MADYFYLSISTRLNYIIHSVKPTFERRLFRLPKLGNVDSMDKVHDIM